LLAPVLTAIESFGLYAQAEENSWRYGASEFGKLKYPAQFAHFDYVNPQAPRARKTMPTEDTSRVSDGRWTMKRILVATDGSEGADRAIDYAARRAKADAAGHREATGKASSPNPGHHSDR
jgi:hypothetical protein